MEPRKLIKKSSPSSTQRGSRLVTKVVSEEEVEVFGFDIF